MQYLPMDIEIHRHKTILRNIYALASSIYDYVGIEPRKDGKLRNEVNTQNKDISIHEGVCLY